MHKRRHIITIKQASDSALLEILARNDVNERHEKAIKDELTRRGHSLTTNQIYYQ